MNAQQTRVAADRQIEKLLAASTPAEQESIQERDEQGRLWREQLIELQREIGNRCGNAEQCPVVNDGTVGIYDE